MRSKEQLLQSERALATAEASLQLLREQYALQESRRQSERREDSAWLKAAFANVHEKLDGLAKIEHNNTAVLKQHLGEKLDQLHEVAQIPTRDIPTIDELVDQARTDTAKRKLLQNTLAELEFADTEIEYP